MTLGGLDRARRTVPSDPASARAIRRFVAETLRGLGAVGTVIADFELAVSELAANAIEHGNGDPITVEVDGTDTTWWKVAVVGHLPERMPASLLGSWTVAPPIATSGRGLGIVRRLMDDVTIDAHGTTLAITCCRRRST